MILDHFIFDHNIKRRVCILTSKEEELRNYIIDELHSGATIYEAIGAYNYEKHNEIITIVDKNEYQKLMSYINEIDPKAFITVYTVSNMKYQPRNWNMPTKSEFTEFVGLFFWTLHRPLLHNSTGYFLTGITGRLCGNLDFLCTSAYNLVKYSERRCADMFRFTKDCLIGVEQLDREHEHLFELINSIF